MAFPVNGVQDSFTRSNQTPPGGNWLGKIFSTDVDLGVVSNHLEQPTGSSQGSAVWNVTLGDDQEAYATMSLTTDVADTSEIWCRGTNLGTTTPNGYALRFTDNGAGADTLQLYKCVSGTYTQLGSTFTGTVATGDKIGIEAIGTALKAYHFTGGAWNQRISVTDSTQTTGKIGAMITATNNEFDDWGGGSVLAGGTGAPFAPMLPGLRHFMPPGVPMFGFPPGVTPTDVIIPPADLPLKEIIALQAINRSNVF